MHMYHTLNEARRTRGATNYQIRSGRVLRICFLTPILPTHPLPLALAQRVRPRGALRIDNAGNTNMVDIGGCVHHRGWLPVSGQDFPRVHPHLSGEPIFYTGLISRPASDSVFARVVEERKIGGKL